MEERPGDDELWGQMSGAVSDKLDVRAGDAPFIKYMSPAFASRLLATSLTQLNTRENLSQETINSEKQKEMLEFLLSLDVSLGQRSAFLTSPKTFALDLSSILGYRNYRRKIISDYLQEHGRNAKGKIPMILLRGVIVGRNVVYNPQVKEDIGLRMMHGTGPLSSKGYSSQGQFDNLVTKEKAMVDLIRGYAQRTGSNRALLGFFRINEIDASRTDSKYDTIIPAITGLGLSNEEQATIRSYERKHIRPPFHDNSEGPQVYISLTDGSQK